MKAARIQPAPEGSTPYSAENPAPASAITLVDLPIPTPASATELIVRVHASTVIRDNLTWPEMYDGETTAHLGNDFAGVVAAVYNGHDSDSSRETPGFNVGDEVYGMTNAHRGGAWAEYAVVRTDELAPKPRNFGWEAAASLPLSALTADQALFVHGELSVKASAERAGAVKRVLITGSSGGVGRFLVQFAARAGHTVIAASSSNARNYEFLHALGATQIVEYGQFDSLGGVDVIVDTVGGSVLERCWDVIKDGGRLVSIDSADMEWVKNHQVRGLSKGKEQVKPIFFIVEPSRAGLLRIAEAMAESSGEGLVAKAFPFEKAQEAYELVHSGKAGRGKVVVTM